MKNTKMLLLVLLIVGAALMVWRFWDVLMLFLLSGIFAFLLNPVAKLMCRKSKIKRGFAVALTITLFIAILVAIIALAVPSIAGQIGSLVGEIRNYATNLNELIDQFTGYLERLNIPQPVLDVIANVLAQSDKYIASFLSGIFTTLVSISLRLFDLVIIVILTVYFMLDGEMLIKSFIVTLPKKHQIRATEIVKEGNIITWKYIKSRVLISAGMAVVVYITLTLLGMDYALLFAVLAFLLDFIPYFGSIISSVLQTFFALITGGVGFAITVCILVTVIQQIEGNVIAPKVQGDLTGIHPITVMFSILVCNQIWGPLGMLISVPIAAILKLILKEMYTYIVTPNLLDEN